MITNLTVHSAYSCMSDIVLGGEATAINRVNVVSTLIVSG